MENQYDLQVFLSSTFDETTMRETREAFRNEINARLNNIVGLMGGNAFLFDLQLGIPEGTDALTTLEICFDKIKESNCFVFILSEKYGRQNTRVFLLGDKTELPVEAAQSPYAETIRQGVDEELYIIELEVLEAEKNPALEDNRFFFFDKKLAGARGNYAAEIKEKLVEKYQADERVMEFETPEDIKEKFVAYFADKISQEADGLTAEVKNQNLFYAGMLRYYVENTQGIELLEAYQKSASRKALVLHGESGSGKSTLLADWTKRYGEREDFITYYVGIKGTSLLQMLLELYQRHWSDFPHKLLEADEQKLVENFYGFLSQLGEAVLVLDGLNQLTTEQPGRDKYAWVPKLLPENVKLVLSTTDSLADKEVEVCEVPQMDVLDILGYILAKEGKELETETIAEALREAPLANTQLPVLARILYNEISENFQYDTIRTELLVHLKNIPDISTLYQHYIERLQLRFGKECVGDALALILLAKDGLSLDDLRGLVPDEGLVDLFYMLYHEFTHDSKGRIKFGHRYFYQTVEEMLAVDSGGVRHCRFNLINWFEARYRREQDLELIPEIAYQLYEVRDERGMLALLKDVEKARYLYELDRYLLVQYTSFLKSPESLAESWEVGEDRELLEFAMNFLADIGKYGALVSWCNRQLDKGERPDVDGLLYMGLTRGNMELWDYKEARAWGEMAAEVLTLSQKAGENSWHLIDVYNYMAEAHYRLGEFDEALKACQMVLETAGEESEGIYNHTVVDTHLLMAEIYSTPENPGYDPEKALRVVRAELEHCIQVQGEMHPDTAYCYDCLGKYATISDQEAIDSFQKGIRICETTLGADHALTANLYDNLAIKYAGMEQHEQALVWHERSLASREKVYGPEHELVGISLVNIGATLTYLSRFQESLRYFDRARKIYEKMFGANSPRMIDIYQNTAIAWGNMADYQRCVEWNKKAAELLERKTSEAEMASSEDLMKLKNCYHDIAYSYHQIAEGCKNSGDMDNALRYQKEFRGYAKKERSVRPGVPIGGQSGGSAGAYGKFLIIWLSVLLSIGVPVYLWHYVLTQGGAWIQVVFAAAVTGYCWNHVLKTLKGWMEVRGRSG